METDTAVKPKPQYRNMCWELFSLYYLHQESFRYLLQKEETKEDHT